MDEGKIVLGGCCIYIPSPDWHCTTCSLDYYSGGYGEWLKNTFLEKIEFDEEDEYSPFENKSFSQLPESIKSFIQQANNTSIKDLNFAFKFEIGGYTAYERIEYIFFKNTLIKYVTKAPMPRFIESIPEGIYILNKPQIKKLKEFFKNNIWERRYDNNDILDGTQWNLEAKINSSIIESYGHMEFPKVYEEFNKLLEEIVNPKPINDFN